MKQILAGIAFALIGSTAYAACEVAPSQVVNSQRWHHTHEPIISKYIQRPDEAFIIAYQRNTSHAVEFEMVKGCWTGKVKVISLSSFRQLFGAKGFDAFAGSKDT